MKMENSFPLLEMVFKSISVATGDAVDKGQLLVNSNKRLNSLVKIEYTSFNTSECKRIKIGKPVVKKNKKKILVANRGKSPSGDENRSKND
jgi:hypothetical protein